MSHARQVRGNAMADARRMGKSELFSHFAERFEVKRTQAREYFDELTMLAEKELKRSGEFVLPGMGKIAAAKRKARPGSTPRSSGGRRSQRPGPEQTACARPPTAAHWRPPQSWVSASVPASPL